MGLNMIEAFIHANLYKPRICVYIYIYIYTSMLQIHGYIYRYSQLPLYNNPRSSSFDSSLFPCALMRLTVGWVMVKSNPEP